MARDYRTPALVLRSFGQGESDRIVHLYTKDAGRVSAIAKGARRSRRRFPGTLEIFSVLDVQLVDPPRSSLQRLEGARLVRPLEGLTADLGRYAIGCHLLELLDRLTGEGEVNPDMFDFAVGVLEVVSTEEPDRLLAVLVLAKTLARLGYRPQLVRCALCGGALSGQVYFVPRQGGAACGRCSPEGSLTVASRLLEGLDLGIRTPLRDRAALGLSGRDVARAEQLLERFFQFHIGLELRSAPFLRRTLATDRVDARPEPGDTPRPRPAAPRGAD